MDKNESKTTNGFATIRKDMTLVPDSLNPDSRSNTPTFPSMKVLNN